jgi:hypothetical protein
VRIAVSGTHVTGKSSLVAALGARMPNHVTVPEPYELLAARGYEFEDPPSIEDFVVQLKRSLATLRRGSPNLIVDRCPLDFVAYIFASRGAERFDVERWRAPIAAAMASLDLVVAVRIDPAHDPVGAIDDAAFRRAVDAELRDLVDGDSLDVCGDVPVLSLGGPWDRRADTVLACVNALRLGRRAGPS